jgi:hypothetical protein
MAELDHTPSTVSCLTFCSISLLQKATAASSTCPQGMRCSRFKHSVGRPTMQREQLASKRLARAGIPALFLSQFASIPASLTRTCTADMPIFWSMSPRLRARRTCTSRSSRVSLRGKGITSSWPKMPYRIPNMHVGPLSPSKDAYRYSQARSYAAKDRRLPSELACPPPSQVQASSAAD